MTYTAAMLAQRLGKTPQAVRQQLRAIKSTAVLMIAGNPTQAWAECVLPPSIKSELAGSPIPPVRPQGFAKGISKPIYRQADVFCHDQLLDEVRDIKENHLKENGKLTTNGRGMIYAAAYWHVKRLAASEIEEAQRSIMEHHARRSVREFLLITVSELGDAATLKRDFNRQFKKLEAANGDPNAIKDKRASANKQAGRRRRGDFSEDENKIRDRAILLEGNESLAERQLRAEGVLSAEYIKRYPHNPRRRKSGLRESTRRNITPQVDMCAPIHRGPHFAKMRGPYILRDWSDVAPADWYQSDDITWNNYFYFYDEQGQLHIERGECLLFVDLRSCYPLHHVLIAGKYNSLHIRLGMGGVFELHGRSRYGWYLEGGVWQAKTILPPSDRNVISWADALDTLRQRRLDVRRATTPRAKPIERIILNIQERQRNLPGYCGPLEQAHKMERFQEFKARALAGKEHPGNELLEMSEWKKMLDATLLTYANEPQLGKMLNGLSPAELWNQRQPPEKFPDDARFMGLTHCIPTTVRQEGIALQIRGKRHLYYNEETGRRIGKPVLAFYNFEQPELLTVCAPDKTDYFTVKSAALPAMSATKEQFAERKANQRGHMQAARVIYGNIQHQERKFIQRDDAVSEEIKNFGRFHDEEHKRFKEDQSAHKRKYARAIRAAEDAGIQLPENPRHLDSFIEGAKLLTQRPASMDCESSEVPAPEISFSAPESPAPAQPFGPRPSAGLYWNLWNKVAKVCPEINRHALTQKALGSHPPVNQMSPEQLAKMIDVFSAVLREASATK
jgi:hypothetical protein